MKNLKINIFEASTGLGVGETQSAHEIENDLEHDIYIEWSENEKINYVIVELIDQISDEIRRVMKPS